MYYPWIPRIIEQARIGLRLRTYCPNPETGRENNTGPNLKRTGYGFAGNDE